MKETMVQEVFLMFYISSIFILTMDSHVYVIVIGYERFYIAQNKKQKQLRKDPE